MHTSNKGYILYTQNQTTMSYNPIFDPLFQSLFITTPRTGYSYCIYCGDLFKSNVDIFEYKYPDGKLERICDGCNPEPELIKLEITESHVYE